MEKILIDLFIVPEESKIAFLEASSKAQHFIRSLPGFVEGFVYEQKGGDSTYNFMTTVVWENEDAFENAKRDVAIEYQKQGFNPQETLKALDVKIIRSVYERSAY